jgi:hypothetical protein
VRARLSAVGAALALLAAGCGGGGPSARDEVASYIEKVNAAQAKLAAPARTVAAASGSLAKTGTDQDAVARRLDRAAAQFDRGRARIAALAAPPEAKRLRSLQLELTSREAALARELAALARFLPAYAAALTPLVSAGKRLQRALAVPGLPERQAVAVDEYRQAVLGTLRRVRTIDPPAVSRPEYESQIAALRSVGSSAEELAAALRAKQTNRVASLVRKFQQASVSNRSLAAQRAQIAAIRAYNARVRSLDTLTTRIYRERARLQTTLD